MKEYIRELMKEGLDYEEIVDTVMEYAMEKEMEYGYEDLSKDEMISYMIGMLFIEVNQGGFDQYFLKTSAKYVIRTVEFLDLIGEERVPMILEEAYSIYKAVIPDDLKVEEYKKIDHKFYQLETAEMKGFYDRFVEYFISNKTEELT